MKEPFSRELRRGTFNGIEYVGMVFENQAGGYVGSIQEVLPSGHVGFIDATVKLFDDMDTAQAFVASEWEKKFGDK